MGNSSTSISWQTTPKIYRPRDGCKFANSWTSVT